MPTTTLPRMEWCSLLASCRTPISMRTSCIPSASVVLELLWATNLLTDSMTKDEITVRKLLAFLFPINGWIQMEREYWWTGGYPQLPPNSIALFLVLLNNMTSSKCFQASTLTEISLKERTLPVSNTIPSFNLLILNIQDMGGSKLSYLALQSLIGAANMTEPSIVPGTFIFSPVF